MANGPQNPSPSRRSFRLSPLEMMIMGLIVVGVLYLVSIWILGARVEEKKPPAAPPRTLLDRALAATEIVRAQLASQKKELDAALKRVKELDKALSAGGKLKADPRLVHRLQRLEKQVAALGKARPQPRGGDPKAQARLAALEKEVARLKAQPAPATSGRMDKVEKRLARLEKKQATPVPPAPAAGESAALKQQVATLEKRLDQVAAREKEAVDTSHLEERLAALEKELQRLRLAAAIGGASAGAKASPSVDMAALARLEGRVQGLERALIQAQDSLRRVRAPVPDPELTARVDKLEKTLVASARARPPTVDPGLRMRLAALENKVAALAKKPARPRVSGPPRPAAHRTASPTHPTRIRHRVRRGDTLYAIARRYKVTVKDIKQWNPKLKKRRHLWVGEKIIIYRGG